MKRMYLAINSLLAHTPCNKLRVLRTEIEDEYKFVVQKNTSMKTLWYVFKRRLSNVWQLTKIHIIVGAADRTTSTKHFACSTAELKKLGSDASVEYLDGLTHFDLYKIEDDQKGLLKKIQWEMYKVARPKAIAAGKQLTRHRLF